MRTAVLADAAIGPTYNAAINGAVYWNRFGASDTTEDRFPAQLGPTEVSYSFLATMESPTRRHALAVLLFAAAEIASFTVCVSVVSKLTGVM